MQRIVMGVFSDCYSDFRRGLERTSIRLPRGQFTQVLRHTFAMSFHDERWEYSGTSEDPRESQINHDDALCAFVAGTPGGSQAVESVGGLDTRLTAKWKKA